ncbi:MAG: hypothetical protein WCG01_04250 [bacterium]
MPDPKIKLLSIDVLFKQALDMYKIAFKQFFWLQLAPLLAFIPVMLFGVLLAYAIKIQAELPIMLGLGFITFMAFSFGLYYGIMFSMAPYMLLRNLKPDADWKQLLFEGRPFLGKFIGVSLLYGLIIFAGLLFFIIPGIIFAVQYSFVVLLVIIENKSTDAFERSKELVRHYWWEVALRLSVPLIFSLTLSILSDQAGKISGLEPLNMVAFIVSLLMGPVFMIYNYAIYQDLVRIKGI